jgi:uncharacterized protein (TIGR00251 family)
LKFKVYVKIGRRQGIKGWDGETLTVGVDAPPVDGSSNARLIEIISNWLSLSKSQVQIIKGHTARYKTLQADVPQDKFDNLLNNLPRLPKQQTLL